MARQAGVPTTRETPDLIIGRALEFRVMMFEFYALLNLARITLDSLRVFLRPLFKTDYGQLPKSVRSFVKGKTDWTSVRFEQKVTVLRVMVTQTLFASCDAACTPVKVQMHRGLILG
jgi:hypothetical protein